MANNLSLYRGDAVTFSVTLTLGGSPVNLDDYITFFTAKKRLTDPDSKAVIRKSTENPSSGGIGGINITDASAGKCSIVLLHTDTKDLLGGTYKYGINCVNKADPSLVYTLLEGDMTVSLDVGIRIAADPTTGSA